MSILRVDDVASDEDEDKVLPPANGSMVTKTMAPSSSSWLTLPLLPSRAASRGMDDGGGGGGGVIVVVTVVVGDGIVVVGVWCGGPFRVTQYIIFFIM